jgi:hypothetical protein
VHARFCGNCDTSLGAEMHPVPAALPRVRDGLSPSGPIPVVNDTRAVPPRVDLEQSKAVLQPGINVTLQMRIRNASTIVDAYGVMAESAPGWLTVDCLELRLMPGENDYLSVELGILAGRFVEAQTLTVRLRVYSLRDKTGYTDVPLELTVPRYGRPVAIHTHPALVRLTDTTAVRVQVVLDNAASNYARRLALTGYDSEGVVRCLFNPATAVVPPGGKTAVDLEIAVPRVRDGENRSRQLSISGVDDEGATTSAIITVNQARSAAPPVRLSLEPSVLRVRDGGGATVGVVVDNRGRTPNRTVRLKAEDPEGRVQFSFDHTTLEVARNAIASTTVYLTVEQVPSGAEVSREFSVIAGYDTDEVRASGTLVQSASDLPLKSAALRLVPESLYQRHGSKGRFRIAIENKDESQWLNLALSGSDGDHVVDFDFSRTRFDIPPRGLAWGWIDVSAPQPKRGREASHDIEITATEGDESVSTVGTFIHSNPDWVRYVRYVLTALGAVVSLVGAFLPWTVAQQDYLPVDLGLISSADFVAKTQPSARLAVIVLVVVMIVGMFGKSGKLTITAGAAIAVSLFGYLIVLSTKVVTDGPMYGAILVVVGAIVGLIGGLLARL